MLFSGIIAAPTSLNRSETGDCGILDKIKDWFGSCKPNPEAPSEPEVPSEPVAPSEPSVPSKPVKPGFGGIWHWFFGWFWYLHLICFPVGAMVYPWLRFFCRSVPGPGLADKLPLQRGGPFPFLQILFLPVFFSAFPH